VAGVPFAFFPDIDQVDAGLFGFDVGIVNGDFFDTLFGVIDQFEELRAMQHGGTSLAQIRRGSSIPAALRADFWSRAATS
jgi:hypothetical protein